MIATDNKEHQSFIKNYFEENDINNISVMLIGPLRESQKTGERPSIPNINDNNGPASVMKRSS